MFVSLEPHVSLSQKDLSTRKRWQEKSVSGDNSMLVSFLFWFTPTKIIQILQFKTSTTLDEWKIPAMCFHLDDFTENCPHKPDFLVFVHHSSNLRVAPFIEAVWVCHIPPELSEGPKVCPCRRLRYSLNQQTTLTSKKPVLLLSCCQSQWSDLCHWWSQFQCKPQLC